MAGNYEQTSGQDISEQMKTYNGFIRLMEVTGAITAGTLLLMFFFLVR